MAHEEKIDDQSSERKHPPFEDGSPITVGGGGGKKPKDRERANVSCRFKDGDFAEEGDPDHGRHKYRHRNSGKIKFLKIRKRGQWTDHSVELPSNGKCEIVISCKGNDDDVTINGNKFGIDMNPDTYKIVDGAKHTNPNAGSYITYVGLRDLNTNELLYSEDFIEADDCEVWADHITPSVYPHDEERDDQSSERERPREDGSPITVGGGGGFDREGKNRCTFNEDHYPDPDARGNPKKKVFKHSGWQITTFKMYTTATGTRDYSVLLPINGECEIEVSCKSDGDDVTIISRKVDGHMEFGIDMDTRTYKDKPHPTVHENPDDDSYIYQVELKGNGFNHKWTFERDAQCGICTDYIKNSPKCPSE